uniref:NADH-ubiquinone oxidoreductase chain 2 n=1 Tax=Trypetoptera punctulata TaxID=305554 RepID=A0A6B9RBZ3_TRYPU|nr:NADH dehydrogenase subunit 2 [Trypetoptera punctulata]
MSSLVTVSSNSWLGAWMGLEINLLSFIPLMSDSNNLMTSEASLKYFLTQALASSILLFAAILLMMESNLIFTGLLNSPSLMVVASLLMKSGAAPFHFWFPMVIEGLSWTNALILMTWQKLAPLMMISYMNTPMFIEVSVILSVVIGSVGGLNQTSIRKLLAYSSINHLGWLLVSVLSSEMLWINYYSFYVFLSVTVVTLFNLSNLNSMKQLFFSTNFSSTVKMFLFMSLLSLGGLPPFVGFFPKWMVIQLLSTNHQFVMMTILVTFSLVTLFFYLRMGYSAFSIGHSESNWFLCSSLSKNTLYLMTGATFLSSISFSMISLFFWLN